MDTAERAYSGLNDDQLHAVTAPLENHYLILAGAGCGKTTVLTRRIAFLIRERIASHSILAVTFTRKAAEEMNDRLRKLLSLPAPTRLPEVTTFHSFALNLLRSTFDGKKNFERIGFRSEVRHCEEHRRMELLAESSTTDQRNLLGVNLSALDALVEKCTVFPGTLKTLTDEKNAVLRSITETFSRRKRSAGVWDFSDLVSGALNVLTTDTQVCRHYRNAYTHILVDEFQDTNPLQLKLLTCLLGDRGRLFAVGDDDQAIYGFRGADIGPTIHFEDIFNGARIIKLQVNYRSMPPILATANRLFRSKPAAYRKVLVSGRYRKKEGKAPSRFLFSSDEELYGWIIQKAAQIGHTAGIAPDEMAALFRINQSVVNAESCFTARNVEQQFKPRLMTVHASKGLEFPVVFLCDLEEGIFPNYRIPVKARIRSFTELLHYPFSASRQKIECNWEEELRLFYVAITRAQQQLFFCASRQKKVYTRIRHYKASRFLRLI
jgi:DNA helicase II / ATP-dependent DNA helicase PcrA